MKLGTSFSYSLSRASKALGCMFTLAKSNKRIQRLYVYQFNPAADPQNARFDAGLINPDGSAASRLRRGQVAQGAPLPQVVVLFSGGRCSAATTA